MREYTYKTYQFSKLKGTSNQIEKKGVGTLFMVIIAAIVILGVAAIFYYARDKKDNSNQTPRLNFLT